MWTPYSDHIKYVTITKFHKIFTWPGHNKVNFRHLCTKYLRICWLQNENFKKSRDELKFQGKKRRRKKRGGMTPCRLSRQALDLLSAGKYIIAPNNRRPASTIVYLILCLISLLLTVTLIVSLVQLAQNTSLCPDRQPTLGPRPAGPLLTRDRGGQRRRPTHPPRWAWSNQWKKQWEANTKKCSKTLKSATDPLWQTFKCQIEWPLALHGAARRRTPRIT